MRLQIPKSLIRYRCAMGHIWDGETWELSSQPWLPLGMAPCGLHPTMSASDLVLFARAHLADGQTTSGNLGYQHLGCKLCSIKKLAPQTSQNISRYAGLGWAFARLSRSRKVIYGHTGATNGFYSSLQICPDKNAAFAILINGVAPAALEAIQNDLIKDVFDIGPPVEPAIDHSIDLTSQQRSVVGRYESMDKVITIVEQDLQLIAHLEYKLDPLPPEDLKLFPITDECFGCEALDGTRRPNWAFVMGKELESPPIYLFDGGRLNPRC